MRRLPALLLLAIITFVSCKKGGHTNYSIQPIKKITRNAHDSVYYQQFIYDANDHLVSYIDSNNNGSARTITPSYDAQWKLSSYTIGTHAWSFEYDNNGRIIKKLETKGSTTPRPGLTVYTYNEKGLVMADTTYSVWTGAISNYRTFVYDQDGNLAVYKRYFNTGSSFQLDEHAQMQYNDHPSPYYTVKALFYMTDENEKYLSPNNVVQQSYPDGLVVSYGYQYYGDGSPGSCSVTDNDGSLPEQLAFFY